MCMYRAKGVAAAAVTCQRSTGRLAADPFNSTSRRTPPREPTEDQDMAVQRTGAATGSASTAGAALRSETLAGGGVVFLA
ncbi:hypothetical protein ON010_g19003 [Phytophthora cinnamomi]|nr:hypothetical protein ON010_g19003 [Phytophthora cinnamomi]